MTTDIPISLNQFLTEVTQAHSEMKHVYRYGQVLFNSLAGTRPDIAQEIRATPIDPFYLEADEISADLLELLTERW